jgi:hypothetical protein
MRRLTDIYDGRNDYDLSAGRFRLLPHHWPSPPSPPQRPGSVSLSSPRA